MANEDDLKAAAEAGLIDPAQAEKLKAFLEGRAAPEAPAPTLAASGEEDLRFIRNFHDVFLAMGIAILAIGLAVAVATFVSDKAREGHRLVYCAGLYGGCAAVMWGLGEFFSRRRRLFLPSIAICLSFCAFLAVASFCAYMGFLLGDLPYAERLENATNPVMRVSLLIAALASAGGALLFYLRFRLPFSIGLAGWGLACVALALLFLVAPNQFVGAMVYVQLLCGVALFAAGLAFDMRDPARATRFSDNGFWLHFAAAPLLLNGALGLIGVVGGGMLARGELTGNTGQAVLILIVVAILGVISLLINRRALIVSALLTTGIAIGVLLNAVGLGVGSLAAATLITLGAFVLILGASWHVARRALLGWVKPGGLLARAFPPEPPAAAPAPRR